MTDAFQILGVPDNADDEMIRKAYLDKIKCFPPEHHPEKFKQVRQAYDILKDLETRFRHRLMEAGKNESIDQIIEGMACQSNRQRMSLKQLISLVQKS